MCLVWAVKNLEFFTDPFDGDPKVLSYFILTLYLITGIVKFHVSSLSGYKAWILAPPTYC